MYVYLGCPLKKRDETICVGRCIGRVPWEDSGQGEKFPHPYPPIDRDWARAQTQLEREDS